MENQPKPAKFQFKGFRIEKSVINIISTNTNDNFNIGFHPEGKISIKNSHFELKLGIKIDNLDNTIDIEIVSIADFYFQDIEPDKMEAYLFLNGPALLFPYIRAYISTLTTLSGIKAITLPTMNLTSLRLDLKKNTVYLD